MNVKENYIKMVEWIKTHVVLFQLCLLLFTFLISVISAIIQWYEPLIISLLVFVGLEFFTLSVGSLDGIHQLMHELLKKQNDSTAATANTACQLSEMQKQMQYLSSHKTDSEKITFNTNSAHWDFSILAAAQHTIFISGIAPASLYSQMAKLNGLGSNIKIRILTVDLSDPELQKATSRLFKKTVDEIDHLNNVSDDIQKTLNNREQTILKQLHLLPPIAFVAVDIDELTDASFIKVKHYFLAGDHGESYYETIVKPGHELFPIYAAQIKTLWASTDKVLEKEIWSK